MGISGGVSTDKGCLQAVQFIQLEFFIKIKNEFEEKY